MPRHATKRPVSHPSAAGHNSPLTRHEEELHRLQGVRIARELAEEEKYGPAPHLGGGPFGDTGLTHPDDR